MTETLRPMSLGELLDRTFSLYRKNFVLFVGIATVGPAAYLAFQLLTIGSAVVPRPKATGTGAFAAIGVGMLVGLVIMLAGMAISQAATVKAVAAVHLGMTTSIVGAYKALHGRIWRVLGVFLLVMLLAGTAAAAIIILASIIGSLALIGVARAGTAGAITGGVIALASVVIGVLLAITVYVRYSLSVQACVVEDLRPIASLKRSAVLSKGARSRVLTIYFVFTLLSFIVSALLAAVVGGLAVFLHQPVLSMVLIYLSSFVAGSLTGPLATIGISLLYYDERVRKEAFDLQLMMASLEMAPQQSAAPVQA